MPTVRAVLSERTTFKYALSMVHSTATDTAPERPQPARIAPPLPLLPPKPDKPTLLAWHRDPRGEGLRGLLVTGSWLIALGLLAASVYYGRVWPAIPLVFIVGYIYHTHLVAFHEAAHFNIRRNRLTNDFNGFILGAGGFMSLALYRAAHHTHHAHLATERDEELWPFTDPRVSRWKRRLAAFLELTFGLLYTPLMFLRVFLRSGSPIRERRIRRRIWLELALIVVMWVSIVAVAAFTGGIDYWLVCYLAPAWIAGNIQSWRKYVEHMGMTGTTAVGGTRSVVYSRWPGWLFSYSLFHEPYHGVHHKYPRLPASVLPAACGILAPNGPDERPPFRSFTAALWDMMKTLGDPRIGPRWRVATNQPAAAPAALVSCEERGEER